MKLRSLLKRLSRKILHEVEVRENKEATSKYLSVGKDSIFLQIPRLDQRLPPESRIYVKIGEKCLLKTDFIFETSSGFVSLGNNVHIGGATFLCRERIEIGDDVTMAWGITLYDHNSHSIYWEERKHDNERCYSDYQAYGGNTIVTKDWSHVASKPIVIDSKVWIGFNVTILKGVRIGEGAVVGAGSVVTKDVPPWTVVAGNPARVVKTLSKPE